jgi:hypothetical protein
MRFLDLSNEPSRIVIKAKLKQRRLYLVFALSPFWVVDTSTWYLDGASATDYIETNVVADLSKRSH